MSNFHTALVDRVHLADIESTKWGACKAVLRCLGNHANEAEKDTSWPGVELMMLETGLSERVIVRTTGLLQETGWITKKRRFNTSNLYRLNVAKLQQHQVARPSPKAIHMAAHLPDLLFPGETLDDVVEHVVSLDKPHISGRSTARSRAERADLTVVVNLDDAADTEECAEMVAEAAASDEPEPVTAAAGPPAPAQEERAEETDVAAAAEQQPAEWALQLIAELNYGKHRRPNRTQAIALAKLVEAAHSVHGLPQQLIRRHCKTALNEATKNGVSYLRGALEPKQLPIPEAQAEATTTPAAAWTTEWTRDPNSSAGSVAQTPERRAAAQALFRENERRRKEGLPRINDLSELNEVQAV